MKLMRVILKPRKIRMECIVLKRKIVFEKLNRKEHDRDNFDCQNETLNNFLKLQAAQSQDKNTCVTYVAVELGSTYPKIIYGYYSISATSLHLDICPDVKEKKYLSKSSYLIPAIKLARLARNKLYTQPGFGEYILLEALREILNLSEKVGFLCVDVDAKNYSVKNFYSKYGFLECVDSQYHLMITVSSIKKIFNK